MEGYFIFQWGQLFFRWGEASLLSRVGCPMEGNRLWWGWVQKNHKMRGGAPHAPPHCRKPWGAGVRGWRGLTAGSYNSPQTPQLQSLYQKVMLTWEQMPKLNSCIIPWTALQKLVWNTQKTPWTIFFEHQTRCF